jgi:hypothetical protein
MLLEEFEMGWPVIRANRGMAGLVQAVGDVKHGVSLRITKRSG